MQQTLSGCAFCDSPPGAEMGEAHTWGKDKRVTHPICVYCAVQERPDPEEREPTAVAGVVIALFRIRPLLDGTVNTDRVCHPFIFPPRMRLAHLCTGR
jgi:hypothetical protein